MMDLFKTPVLTLWREYTVKRKAVFVLLCVNWFMVCLMLFSIGLFKFMGF